MAKNTILQPPRSAGSQNISRLLEQYGCGPVRFEGTDNALYDRHLLFDNVIDQAEATPRDRFEAVARSVRDALSQRWVLAEKTYENRNLKRLYYVAMEFLIGRSLSNNVINLMLDEVIEQAAQAKHIDQTDVLEQELDAGLGNGGWRWQPGMAPLD